MKYPLYVISKGRSDCCLTAKFLEQDGVDYKLVVEPQEVDLYAKEFAREKIHVLPFSNLGLGSIPARNWVWEHAKASGAKRHWILDDNIRRMHRRFRARKFRCDSDAAFTAMETFVDRYENIVIAGPNYYMFAPCLHPLPPFFLNVHVYSCVAPNTPILCADLVWRAAGSLLPGQKIVAFDEEPTSSGRGKNARSYRTASIERNESEDKPCFRVTTDVGIPVEASEEHPWLVLRGRPLVRSSKRGVVGDSCSREELCWVETRDLRVGDKIAHFSRPWTRDETHEAGWVSGVYDGEGSLSINKGGTGRGIQLSIAQKPGPVLDRLKKALDDRGFEYGVSSDRSVNTLRINGGFFGAMRFAGEFGPTRLLEKASRMWEGRGVRRGQSFELATVTAVEPIGVRPVSVITTSSGTFITGGYLTHNCILIDCSLPFRWRGRYNEDTDLCLQALAAGHCTVLFNAFLADKATTMTMKGGNMESLYKADGRLKMARSLELAWPGVVKTTRKYGRPQHSVDWRKFDTLPKRRDDVDFSKLAKIDDFGLEMREHGEVKNALLKKIYEETKRE